MVVHVSYKLKNSIDWRLAELRLGNRSIDAMELLIQKKLKEMHPEEEQSIDYKIIGIR